jgi:hypothetical protein
MGCFKQAWSSFWRKDQGIGMIETALLLPIFLMFAFAIIDFGNYLIVKNRIVSANRAIASAIQNKPTISNSDLQKVVQNSLGDLWFKNGKYNGFTRMAIWASQTPPSFSTAPSGPNMWGIKDLKNPWLSDGDPSNDNNAYYIGVRVWRGVPWLTPLPKLLGFGKGTPGFLGVVKGTAPHGRKVADSLTFATLSNASCPADQVLQSMTGGAATCVPRDNNYLCADGQTLEKIVDGNPVCVAVPVCDQPGQVSQFDGANWSCISVLSNLEIYEARQRACYRDNNERRVVATCPGGYGLLACGGGPGDVDEKGEYWVLLPDFRSNRCIGIVMKPRYYGPYWSCTYVSASCYKKN